MAATPLTFLVHERGFDPRRVTTSDDVVKIGRGARLQLELQNPAASRMHAVLEVTEKGATLIDLGCEPSTRVNGVAVNQQALAAGDQIQIGDSVIVVESIGDIAASAPIALGVEPIVLGVEAGAAPTPNPGSPAAWNWDAPPAPRAQRGRPRAHRRATARRAGRVPHAALS